MDVDEFDFNLADDDFSNNDINTNPEEHNKILRIETASFRPGLPDAIMGMKLQNVCITATGPGFRYQKLVLRFVPRHVGLKQCSSDLVNVDVSDISSIKILDWYHPSYPTSNL